ncbi:MAG: hypothetical protein H9W81_07970 [Enterococcus sp.]|nr:hypothetical protein [Enterococcus sp.]
MDEKLELKIYKNYRAKVTSRPRYVGFPAYYRQLAREACVKRYNVSYKEVKRIVAKYDAINGITHEKQPNPNIYFNNPNWHVPEPHKFEHKWQVG